MKVLVVEDEPDVRAVFRDLLTELGHEPVVTVSAEAALLLLGTVRPDAMILDIHLPGLSGLDFLRRRPVQAAGLPIIAMSGGVSESEGRECLRLGAFDFVDKPVSMDRLRAVLDYLEPYALLNREPDAADRVERRRAPRVALEVPVRVSAYDGAEWEMPSVDVSPFGIKVRPGGAVRAGVTAALTFTPPDGGVPIHVESLLVRKDSDGDAFHFVSLTSPQFHRLVNHVFQSN